MERAQGTLIRGAPGREPDWNGAGRTRRRASNSLAPELRVTRRGSGQRRQLSRGRAATAGLLAGARLGEREGRAALEAGLAGLRAALWRSPGWRRRLWRAGLSPEDLTTLEDLAHFPTLDRAGLDAAWDELPVVSDPAEALVVVRSSGSSGRPLRIVRDEYECLHMWAVLEFWLAWLRLPLPPRPRVALLCSLPGGIEYSARLPMLRDGALHRIALALGDARAAERLRRTAPAVLFSDPAGLHWLEQVAAPPRPQLVLSSAQHLPGAQRERLRARLGARVVNYYSTTDTGPLAWECLDRSGRFHVLIPEVWVESIAGELAVTRLRRSPLPLLRYRTGDSGRVVRDECGCGYRGWSIVDFAGRRACQFRTPAGAAVDAWQLAWLFKHYRLGGFRLSQVGPQRFELQLERGPGLADLVSRLEASLRRLGWEAPRVEPLLGALPVAPGAKPEPFRCRLLSGSACGI